MAYPVTALGMLHILSVLPSLAHAVLPYNGTKSGSVLFVGGPTSVGSCDYRTETYMGLRTMAVSSAELGANVCGMCARVQTRNKAAPLPSTFLVAVTNDLPGSGIELGQLQLASNGTG